jgi:purine-binding chemotaxis protein CheW
MLYLVVLCGSRQCGLRIDCVVEIMRPLPVNPMKGVPSFILGSSTIRGRIMPVVSLSELVAGSRGAVQKFVTVRTGARQTVLAVEKVVGIRHVDESVSIPPLLRPETDKPVIDILARLDRELLLILEESHLFPEEIWAELPRQ